MTSTSRKPVAALAAGLACAIALGASPASLAKGDAQRGKSKSASCVACHGEDGNGKKEFPAYPKLAGQHHDYIVRALEAYQSGERKNAIMMGLAAPLSAQDREDLAAWFASQKGLKTLDGQL